jgi:putative ABC transport system permease protein
MFRNYLKTAWRNLVNNKAYSALNILGLATGMAVALLIGLWVYYQLSYDRFLPDYSNQYQVKMNVMVDGITRTQDAVSLPLADVLRKEIPGVKYVVESDWNESHGLVVGDKKLYLNGAQVGGDFLKMFQYPLLEGTPNNVLQETNSIALTKSTAVSLFGNADPVGKIVRFDNNSDLKVTGVLKDIPPNSSMQFSYLVPFSHKEQTEDWMKNARQQWTNNSFQMFATLQPNVRYSQVAKKIKNIVNGRSDQMRPAHPEIIMQPLQDWHLHDEFKNGRSNGGFIDYVRMFGIIGFLVLLIACINFMNLSTARSEKRAREVGVRKTLGSERKDLILQFLVESIIITFIAAAFSLLFAQLALPSFNTLTGTQLSIPFSNIVFWAIMIGYVFITGLLAGSRPAFYLSSFNPVKVLKGTMQVGKSATLSRKFLVVLQFSCSIALIISTLIVYQQIQHIKDRPRGYNENRLMMTDMSDDLNKNFPALKNELLQSGVMQNVSWSSSPVTGIYFHTDVSQWPGKNSGGLSLNIGGVGTSDDYFKTLQMKLLVGKDFSNSWKIDSGTVILNEAAVKRMNLKNPINQTITWNGGNVVRIIGVVQDAVMESPFTPVNPVVFYHGRGGSSVIYRLTYNVSTHTAIDKLAYIFSKYNPSFPYLYHFADESYAQKFKLETLIGKLSGLFAMLAIFISCLGLFALAAYMAELRTKEIGIRKVLGASVSSVWLLLSTDFIVLVIISCVIASPVAFYYMHNWLQQYDYRITISPYVFVAAGIAAIVITILTISFQAIKAAVANPVKSLRTE